MKLTEENYFSTEADKEYMSVSQWKNFKNCQAKAYHDLEVKDTTYKSAFLEGHLFEELVSGNAEKYMQEHPEMISSRGATAGQLKAEFQRVVNAAEKFNSQKFFRNIIDRCEKQVILTGEICEVPVKCCLDLFDRKTNSIYDIKCMTDFKEQWNKKDKVYEPWYYTWGYVLQLAVYREIVKQNFGKEPKEVALLAATKEEVPDIQAVSFSKEILDMELEEFKNHIKLYDDIKKGKVEPHKCNECSYCKKIKEITKFEEVK